MGDLSKRLEGAADFVPVYAASGMPEANLIKSILEAAGMQVLLSGESASAVFGFTVGDMALVEVWVPRDRRADAESIIAELGTPAPDDE